MSNDQPITESDAIFARAYADAIKSKFQVDVGKNYILLTSPVTQRGIAAGDLIYPQMTNYLTYRFADDLQFSDNPSYTGGSAGSYIQQLTSYVNWIKTKRNPSQVIVDKKNKAQAAFNKAWDNYEVVLEKAEARFDKDKKHYPGMTFLVWAATHYPPLAVAVSARKSAQSVLYAANAEYFGPDATVISGYIDRLTNATGTILLPGLTQPGLTDDKDLIAQAVEDANSNTISDPAPIEQSTIPIPNYSIGTYKSTVQAWITSAGNHEPRSNNITINVDKGRTTTWKDYGFKEVHGGGGGGFWPFFYATVYVNGKEERRTLNTKGLENKVNLSLAMIGIQKFNINPGTWDIPNIKVLFPERLPGAPKDVLGPKFARIVSVLVGYDVELKLDFASELREEVNNIYQEVKSSGGSMSIFGFWVSAGGSGSSSSRVETSFNDIKWDKNSGSMSLTPTEGQVYPTILGAVAQRFD